MGALEPPDSRASAEKKSVHQTADTRKIARSTLASNEANKTRNKTLSYHFRTTF